MGRNNQQRRAAKAKERRRRTSAATEAGFGGEAESTSFFGLPMEPQRPPSIEETIVEDISEIVECLAHGSAERAEVPLRRLLALEHAPGHAAVVTRQLAGLLASSISALWPRGWRPVDLHQIVGRELDTRARTVTGDAMAAGLSAFATVTLAPDWPGQLREAGATVWWSPDTDFVTERARADGFEPTVRAALELAALLWGLPDLEAIDPIPGTAPAAGARRVDHADERLLERVRRLLAQAESTTYEAEAETFTAAAQSLMARHSIDRAMLSATARAPGDRPVARRTWIERPYEAEKVQLLHVVASANRCRTVWSNRLGCVTIVGFGGDHDAIDAIFTSLLVQGTRAMRAEGRSRTGARTTLFRRSFLGAFAAHVGQRLRQATEAETAAAVQEQGPGSPLGHGSGGGSRALVRILEERSGEVDAAVEEIFPELTYRETRSTYDPAGWAAGRRAAEAASIFGAGQTLPR